jgi:NtrC-family two-component system sensor histidine kinase KinB
MNFTLRQKIFIVFVLLLMIAAVIGTLSIQRFNLLGRSIDVILKENYRSVIACQRMKDALERMDSGLLFIISGFVKEGIDQIEENRKNFQDALQQELDNLTLPGESARVYELQTLYESYSQGVEEFMKFQPQLLGQRYFDALFPLFKQIKNRAEGILQMNQENMNTANDRARAKAANARRDMILLLSLSALVALLFMLFSNNWILRPIQRLIASTQEIRKGNLNLVIKADTHDEIGQLSEAFNSMVASLRLFRRSDQEKLMRIQRSTQEAFQNLPSAIAIIDIDGTVEIATASARAHFGLVPGVAIERAAYPWLAELHHSARANLIPQGNDLRHEVIQQFRENQERFYKPKVIPILNAEKEFCGSIIILEDVTLMMQNDEIKKDLFSTISHQLKTPLTAIRMAHHLLLEENIGSLNEKQADLLVAARDESDRLNGIIDDLLDIRRLESGSAQLSMTAVSASDLVEEAAAPLRRTAQDKGVRIEIDLPADLPSLRADRSRIMYVFANLLSNAIKYSPVGGIVRVNARKEGDKVWFSVQDEGAGIPKKFHKQIFEKFFRVPGQAAEGGAGLGLSIAKEILVAHGGSISFHSIEDQGTTFTFSLAQFENPSNGGL